MRTIPINYTIPYGKFKLLTNNSQGVCTSLQFGWYGSSPLQEDTPISLNYLATQVDVEDFLACLDQLVDCIELKKSLSLLLGSEILAFLSVSNPYKSFNDLELYISSCFIKQYNDGESSIDDLTTQKNLLKERIENQSSGFLKEFLTLPYILLEEIISGRIITGVLRVYWKATVIFITQLNQDSNSFNSDIMKIVQKVL